MRWKSNAPGRARRACSRASFLIFAATAPKIAWRDLHASPAKFLFVILAVAVGVAALSGVKGFGYAFKGMLLRNAKQLIAADLQAQTWNDPAPDQLDRLRKIGHQYGSMTRVTETISMAASEHERIPQMVSVKSVDPAAYPFYGALTLEPAEPLRDLLKDDSSVVVTPELMMRLKVAPGDVIRLGGKDYRITGKADYRAGQAGLRFRSRHAGSDEPRGAGANGSYSIRK